MDDDGSKSVSYAEWKKGLAELGLTHDLNLKARRPPSRRLSLVASTGFPSYCASPACVPARA